MRNSPDNALPTLLVIGEALVDNFRDGPVAGGAPFNVARSAAAFGVPTTLVSRIGLGDAAGELVVASAQRFGLDGPGLQRDAHHATGVVSVVEHAVHAPDVEAAIAESAPVTGHRFEIASDAAWDYLDRDAAVACATAARPAFVVFGTLGQRSPASRTAIRAVLNATPALRYLDLNLRDGPDNRSLAQESVTLADWLKVNEDELALLLGWFVSSTAAAAPVGSAEHHAAVAALMAHFALDRVVLTLGAQGYASWGPGGIQDARGASPAPARLVDTVGAGDAFSAALLALQILGRPLPVALALAARYASAICAERGPIPTQDSFFAHWRQEFGLAATVAASAPGKLAS